MLRPLQINFLFPVHRPHLVTVSSKYSIIPYSSIISGYSCILTGSVKAILKQCQLTCQEYNQVGTFVLFSQLEKEGTSLSMLLCSFSWLCQANNGLKNCQSYNEIMEISGPPARMQICLSPGRGNREFIWSGLTALDSYLTIPIMYVHGFADLCRQ